MLLTYLKSIPYSKFILIADNTEEPADEILRFLINSKLELLNYKVHYLIFEGYYKKKRIENVITYDFVSDLRNWDENEKCLSIENVISQINCPSLIFIDSLVHVIFKYGFQETYRLLHSILNNANVFQTATVFHSDLLEDDKFLKYFQHLSTFYISLEAKFLSNKSRLTYTYKKSGGKVIKQVEEFYFENNTLKTEPVKKLDTQTLLQNDTDEIKPDTLTTFKISLEDQEKKAKDKVVLPYLPKESTEEGAKIFYQFDEIDDWDEEDPDDDLDI